MTINRWRPSDAISWVAGKGEESERKATLPQELKIPATDNYVVPRTTPGSVLLSAADMVGILAACGRFDATTGLANPKSSIFARPSRVMKMPSGLRSRCARFLLCAAANPCAICTAQSIAQAVALEQFRYKKLKAVLLANVMGRENVGMTESGDGARFLLMARTHLSFVQDNFPALVRTPIWWAFETLSHFRLPSRAFEASVTDKSCSWQQGFNRAVPRQC